MAPLTIVTGIAYIVLQWRGHDEIDDPWFVGIIMANTFAIYRFAMLLKDHLVQSAQHYVAPLKDSSIGFSEDKFTSDIFNTNNSLLCGIPFGSAFLVATLLASPWGGDSEIHVWPYDLNICLGVFLTVANIITGMALYSLAIYFRYALVLGRNIEVDLWDRSSPAMSALVTTNRYVVLGTAFVACAGMVSILLSKFEIDYLIGIFSIFSITVILLAYVVPLIPITAQIRQKKKQSMDEVGRLIQKEYEKLLDLGREERSAIDISRFESLATVYKSTKSIRTFPPVGEQSVNTAISVTFLTMLPSLIEFVLSGFVKAVE